MKKYLFVLIAAMFLVACGSSEETEENNEKKSGNDKAEAQTEENVEEKAEAKKENKDGSKENAEEEDGVWDDVKDQDKIIGESNKDFSEITKNKPSDVRNDKTGKWKITKMAESIDMEEYALSYQEQYMEEGEIHFIVNFTYNTTTVLNYMDDLLYVDIHEYVDKEEHDASVLGSGMLLKSYFIYPDGDIEEIEV